MRPHRAPLLLGHRGSPHECRENTIASFQAALDAGLDGVEWDVRRLRDGTLVIHHDERLADGRRLPELMPQALPSYVPTLHEALAWAADAGAFVNVELKHESVRPDDRVHRTLDAIRAHGLRGRVIVSSFMPTLLRAAREAAPDIERGLLTHREYPDWLVRAVMRWADCAALHPHCTLVTEELMARARTRGWRVNTWTVNEETEVKRLVSLGVDGLIGDLPQALLKARAP